MRSGRLRRVLVAASALALTAGLGGSARVARAQEPVTLADTTQLSISFGSTELPGLAIMWRGPDPAEAPLVWDGNRFSLQYVASDGSGDRWAVSGVVDGTTLVDLVASEYRGTDCPTGYGPGCETSFDLGGPLPLAGPTEQPDASGGARSCFDAFVEITGEDSTQHPRDWIRETGQVVFDPANPFPGIDEVRSTIWVYAEGVDPRSLPRSFDVSTSLAVSLCTSGPAPEEPTTGLVWRADGVTEYSTGELALDSPALCVSKPDGTTHCLPRRSIREWGDLFTTPGLQVEPGDDVTEPDRFLCETTIGDVDAGRAAAGQVASEVRVTYCSATDPGDEGYDTDLEGTVVSRHEWRSEHTWQPPPDVLVPREEWGVAISVAATTTDPAGPPATSATYLLAYPDDTAPVPVRREGYDERGDLTYVDGLLPSEVVAGNAVALTPGTVSVVGATTSGTVDLRWEVPAGRKGDRMAIGVLAWGVGGAHLVAYHYVMAETGPDGDGGTGAEEGGVFDGPPLGVEGLDEIPGPQDWGEALGGILGPAALIALIAAAGRGGNGAGGSGEPGPGGEPGAGPGGAPTMTVVDALGTPHTYDWSDEYGGYVNPLTGGMFDPTLWNEFNANVAANRAFADAERAKLERGETATDRAVNPERVTSADLEAWLDRLSHTGPGPGTEAAGRRAAELADRVARGEYVSRSQLAAVDRFVEHARSGVTAPESSLARPLAAARASEGVFSSLANPDIMKTVVGSWLTGRDPDGSTNYGMIGARIGAAILTGGTSEFVWGPSEAGFILGDSLERGAGLGDAAVAASIPALASLGFGLAGKVAGATAGWAARTSAGQYLAKGFSGLGSEFRVLGQIGGDALGAMKDRVGSILRPVIGPPPLPAALAPVKQQVFRAVKEAVEHGDNRAILDLYRRGGITTLGRLEQAGHLGAREAAFINGVVTGRTNQAVGTATRDAIESFASRAGVHPPVGIRRVYIGDSGSSARGGIRSILTDADRSVIAEFDDAALRNYASANGLTVREAQERLQQRLTDDISHRVHADLLQSGLSADDVHFNGYSGFGEGAGRPDVYSQRFTSMRQASYGTTTVYETGGRSYHTSGQAMVDASELGYRRQTGAFSHGANVETEVGGRLEITHDPTKGLTPTDCRNVIAHAVDDATSHTDVKTLAKALERAERGGRIFRAGSDPELSALARSINRRPQEMQRILAEAGLTPDEFVAAARDETLRINHIVEGAAP